MTQEFQDGRDWFFKHRFGLFVHWGIYAIPAWHEQILWRWNMDPKEYEQYANKFDPKQFNPDEWIDLMGQAGMEYICFTTKHHDGFCMWDTKHTSYNIMNAPYAKDILKMLTDACHRRGIKVGLYYSCVDWHHPFYPNCGRSHELKEPKPNDTPDLDRYYMEYVVPQLEELCTQYGPIHHFFWDLNIAEYKNPKINQMIRAWQPDIMINDRGPDEGDFSTPERNVPAGKRFSRATEACQSIGQQSWGYKRDEDYFSVPFLINSIDKIFCMGGNYLLNVGPDAQGLIPEPSKAILKRIGSWYHSVKESFAGTEPASDMISDERILLTRRNTTLYIHIPIPIVSSGVILMPIDVLPLKATLLNTKEVLETHVDVTPYYFRQKPALRICNIPVEAIESEVAVIELQFDDHIKKYISSEDQNVSGT